MRASVIAGEALTNTKRNKARTSLTVIAVFIGAFTLALTNSIGAGVSTYIGSQLGQIGNDGVMSVSKPAEDAEEVVDDGLPSKYKESTASAQESQIAEASSSLGFSVGMLNDDDLELIRGVEGVSRVEATILAQPKYIEGVNGERWNVTPNIAASVMTPDLTAGKPFTAGGETNEVIIPPSYVEALGYSKDSEAVGGTVKLAVDDVLRNEQIVEAVIVGVNNKSLFGETVSLNSPVSEALIEAQRVGMPEGVEVENSYISAIVHIEDGLSEEQVASMKDELSSLGFEAQTIKDQLGSIQAVIDGIVGVLNGFAVIALIAAGFGIVNTLLMSVQERTREIGLMKAMGLSSSKVYALFSTEAVIIGLLGTVLGVGSAFLLGQGINAVLADTLLADLPGLTISLFTAEDVGLVFGLVMVISLLAGTIPSVRAAKQNPIDALRYE